MLRVFIKLIKLFKTGKMLLKLTMLGPVKQELVYGILTQFYNSDVINKSNKQQMQHGGTAHRKVIFKPNLKIIVLLIQKLEMKLRKLFISHSYSRSSFSFNCSIRLTQERSKKKSLTFSLTSSATLLSSQYGLLNGLLKSAWSKLEVL